MATTGERATDPAIPAKLWLLWSEGNENWVCSVDDAPGGCTLLVSTSEGEAKRAADYQNDLYDLGCRPVRVK